MHSKSNCFKGNIRVTRLRREFRYDNLYSSLDDGSYATQRDVPLSVKPTLLLEMKSTNLEICFLLGIPDPRTEAVVLHLWFYLCC